MRPGILVVFFYMLIFSAFSQEQGRLMLFDQKINHAKTDADKIDALGELAEYYSVFKLEVKADSVLQKALFIAEISSNKDLLFKILFNKNVTNLNIWSNKETFERGIHFIKKGLQYAQELKKEDYAALAHIRLAGLYRKRAMYDEAMEQATQAFTALGDTRADSIKCILYLELGDIYIARADAVPAYKNYNNAFEIAYKQKFIPLQSQVYHRFFELYRTLGYDDIGKSYLIRSLEINTKHNDKEGLFLDNIDLARLTDEKELIDRAASLAQDLNSDRYKLAAKRLLFYWYMTKSKNSSQTFNFLFSNPDLLQYSKNLGSANFHWEMGNIYRYAATYDSAILYFRLAETELSATHDAGIKSALSSAMAETYLYNHDSSSAKDYYEKTFGLYRQINKLSGLPAVSSQLAMLYAKNSDFKLAYYYAIQADSANKLLQLNAAKDKVVLLQVDRENKSRENDMLEAAQRKERKHNLQIMAITVMITAFFAFMLFLGLFAVSKTTIKMLGYFAFISLFEFIVLLLDHPINDFTQGEPLKIWAIKIALIALLVPFQHYLEHHLINFLQSRKLLEARQKFSLKNWWARLKNRHLVRMPE